MFRSGPTVDETSPRLREFPEGALRPEPRAGERGRPPKFPCAPEPGGSLVTRSGRWGSDCPMAESPKGPMLQISNRLRISGPLTSVHSSLQLLKVISKLHTRFFRHAPGVCCPAGPANLPGRRCPQIIRWRACRFSDLPAPQSWAAARRCPLAASDPFVQWPNCPKVQCSKYPTSFASPTL